MKVVSFVFFLIVFHSEMSAQPQAEEFVRGEMSLAYVADNELFLPENKRPKSYRQLSFYTHFDDSISVFLNNRLIESKRMLTVYERSHVLTGKVVFKQINPRHFYHVKILLNDRKEFIEFPLDNRYFFTEIHFGVDSSGSLWHINFSNNLSWE